MSKEPVFIKFPDEVTVIAPGGWPRVTVKKGDTVIWDADNRRFIVKREKPMAS